MIHHLVSAQDWAAAGPGSFRPPSLDTEGFAHCSADVATVLEVANRFYRDLEGEVLLLDLDESRLSAEVRWEAAAHPDGSADNGDAAPTATFPHVYGPIDLCAVVDVRPFVRDLDGTYMGVDRF